MGACIWVLNCHIHISHLLFFFSKRLLEMSFAQRKSKKIVLSVTSAWNMEFGLPSFLFRVIFSVVALRFFFSFNILFSEELDGVCIVMICPAQTECFYGLSFRE